LNSRQGATRSDVIREIRARKRKRARNATTERHAQSCLGLSSEASQS
jgi:hypothetical protein